MPPGVGGRDIRDCTAPAPDRAIIRLRVEPDPAMTGPPPSVGPRPQNLKRPHANATVAAVRYLIDHTTWTYSGIVAKTGVGRASICRWTRDGIIARSTA